MKLAILIGVSVLVLATMATSFPVVIAAQGQAESATNVSDHMMFTREIAEQKAKLDVVRDQYQSMTGVPERIARVEERLVILVQMVYALLVGVFGLLFKELWGAMQTLRGRGANAA